MHRTGRVRVLPRIGALILVRPSPARFRGHPLPGRERDLGASPPPMRASRLSARAAGLSFSGPTTARHRAKRTPGEIRP
ncbi:hypothetical protein DS837_01100 [Azospirillum brasilense]|uniref:Uncharacterized protein n=1 Tax=Azospirillum brasilense TaxID=192 RepID=A0A6L3B5X9_AZOBR|nr:hypothetical protein DS837_01100 [Azospirillum brasilense]